MEDALRDFSRPLQCGGLQGVLILVLMEDALRAQDSNSYCLISLCLNPCSNGRCSASKALKTVVAKRDSVLILVLMEDALRVSGGIFDNMSSSLNPCSNGRCSASFSSTGQRTGEKEVLILVLMEDALRGNLDQILLLGEEMS